MREKSQRELADLRAREAMSDARQKELQDELQAQADTHQREVAGIRAELYNEIAELR